MDISPQSCRLCLSESDFNVSLFGTYCRKTNMLDKILVCLKLVIEKTDHLNTICYKCAENVERFFDFIEFIDQKQTQLCDNRNDPRELNDDPQIGMIRRHVSSYVREQIFDADYTFSFLEISQNEGGKERKSSSPFFSYFSHPNVVSKQSNPRVWGTPQPRCDIKESGRKSQFKSQKIERPRRYSKDIFESQSQEEEKVETRPPDWKLTPSNSIIRRIEEECFGQLNL